jgi:hypothetical protein
MTQYIGQITVILEAETSELASETLCLLANQLDETQPAVVFADHNGEVEDYEQIEQECEESLAGQGKVPLLTVLLASLERCASLLADYDEHPGEEGIAYREAMAAIAEAEAAGIRPAVAEAIVPIVTVTVRGGLIEDMDATIPIHAVVEDHDVEDFDTGKKPARSVWTLSGGLSGPKADRLRRLIAND